MIYAEQNRSPSDVPYQTGQSLDICCSPTGCCWWLLVLHSDLCTSVQAALLLTQECISSRASLTESAKVTLLTLQSFWPLVLFFIRISVPRKEGFVHIVLTVFRKYLLTINKYPYSGWGPKSELWSQTELFFYSAGIPSLRDTVFCSLPWRQRRLIAFFFPSNTKTNLLFNTQQWLRIKVDGCGYKLMSVLISR